MNYFNLQILDGKKISEKILSELKAEISENNLKPKLDIILIGADYASVMYVEMKKKKCEEIGVVAEIHKFDEKVYEQEVLDLIKNLNENEEVSGIMVQLPVPKNLNKSKILNLINPEKDVDGLTAFNLGSVFQGEDVFLSATPFGIIKLLEEYKIDLVGKLVAILGSSSLVGMPLAGALKYLGATPVLCHSRTKNIEEISRNADIVVAAIGKPKIVKQNWIKEGAVVIDVGTNKDLETGKLCGDVDFESVKEKASFITPVPGGIGPMTIAALLLNTVEVCKNQN